jgi:hypothetical protein
MYTNRCLISLKNAPDLLVAAKRFELDRLTKQIAEFLLSRLNVDNAIEMLVSAHEAGSEALKLACIRLINRHAEKIKRTEKWRNFKTQYVDLVPELYENRVERPEPMQVANLPDVFSAPAMPSESLLTLSKLYENPVKERLPSPTPRLLPPPAKNSQTLPPPPTFRGTQPVQPTQPITQGTSGHFNQRNESSLSSIPGRKTPVKKRSTSITGTRPAAQQPAAPPLTRNVFPSVKQSSEVDSYRRPVNIFEKSVALPLYNQKQSVQTQVSQRQQQQQQQQQQQPAPTKISRAVSPRRVIEIRRSPTLTEIQQEDNVPLGRVISVETMD